MNLCSPRLALISLTASFMLAGCGADTKPMWHTKTAVYSTPFVENDGTVRAFYRGSQSSTTVFSPEGAILDQQPLNSARSEFFNVYHAKDTANNKYIYTLDNDWSATPRKNYLQVRKLDSAGQEVFLKLLSLDIAEGTHVAYPTFKVYGDGQLVVAVTLDRDSSAGADQYLVINVNENGDIVSQKRFDDRFELLSVTATGHILLAFQNQLSILNASDLSVIKTLPTGDIGPGSAPAKYQSLASPSDTFVVLSAHADRTSQIDVYENEQTRLTTLSANGEILNATPWPVAMAYQNFALGDGWYNPKATGQMSLSDTGDVVVADTCAIHYSCADGDHYVRVSAVALSDGSLHWQKQFALPETLPLVQKIGDSLVRTPNRVDALSNRIDLRYMQGKLWLHTTVYSNGAELESVQGLHNLWSLNTATGTSTRYLSTFKQIADYVVTDDQALYVVHYPFSEGITPMGLARYR